MNLKEFFKPTIKKTVLFLILMIGLNYFIISTIVIMDSRELIGIPLGFWPVGSFNLNFVSDAHPLPPPISFSWINFIIDITFWYIISCGIVVLYSKFKKS
ncbi:MAG: hypothetical protein AABX30_02770 [Nanoarchaeota archaeon]